MTAAVLQLPGCAPRKVKQEGRGNALVSTEGVPSLHAIREARRVAEEEAAAVNVKAMEKALIRLLVDVGFGKVKGLAIIEARGTEADQFSVTGAFSGDYAYAQRCMNLSSDMLDDWARDECRAPSTRH